MSKTLQQPSSQKLISNTYSETCLILIHNSAMNTPADIVRLKHPRSGMKATYLFTNNNSVVNELFLFSHSKSWFLNNNVIEKTKLYFSTPIDPLFLVLPYLKKYHEDGKAVPIEDLLVDHMFPDANRLLQSIAITNIELIAERKGPKDLNVWTYSDEKTMNWLIKKVEALVNFFENKISLSKKNCLTEKNCNDDKLSSEKFDKAVLLKNAYELISEYITEDLSSKLFFMLGLSSNDYLDVKKRKKTEKLEENINKKIKTIM